MPKNQFQRMVFAFITVIITVHAYVFYSLYVINGDTLMAVNNTTSVISALNKQGGVYMFGTYKPIWFCVISEFIIAYLLENIVGSPVSFKLACRIFNPAKNHPMIFETAVICATVGIMCPTMSFIAAFLYYPYYMGFNILTLLANWLKLVCLNFPFAYFTQLFFIQPVVRVLFRAVFRKEIEKQNNANEHMQPENEQEAVINIFKRIDEIQKELEHEHRRRKALEDDLRNIAKK